MGTHSSLMCAFGISIHNALLPLHNTEGKPAARQLRLSIAASYFQFLDTFDNHQGQARHTQTPHAAGAALPPALLLLLLWPRPAALLLLCCQCFDDCLVGITGHVQLVPQGLDEAPQCRLVWA